MTEESTDGTPRRLTLDAIFAADDLPEKDVYVEQWGGTIRIKALPRSQIKDAYRRATTRGDTDADVVEQLLVTWASVDPKISPKAFEELQKKNAGPIATIIDAVLGLSGVDKAALERSREHFLPETPSPTSPTS